jgi:tRNA 2-selenouridine synthase
MKQIISIAYYFKNLVHLPIIDVRSHAEFTKGHIIGAYNVELFTDEERAVVGTAYKKESKEKAIAIGYKYVTPKLSEFISKSLEIAPKKELVIICWRGGMRSNAFADHLIKHGFEKVYVIEKGYKSFRAYVLEFFGKPFMLNVLGGYTGTGKTKVLHFLEKKGQQVIDLEGIANHRGSSFGGIGLAAQPTNEHFENKLFAKLQGLNPTKAIWLEDESRAIGSVFIPELFYATMSTMPVYLLDIPLQERVIHLVDIYADLNPKQLADAISRISKRLGYDNAKYALDELENKNYDKVVMLALVYYDKCYLKGLQTRDQSSIISYQFPSVNPEATADFLISKTN